MGRRSISTTKSGKFMNPTDQASKIQKLCNLLKLCQIMPQVLVNLLNSLFEIFKSYSAITHSSSILFILLKGKEARKRELKKVCIV